MTYIQCSEDPYLLRKVANELEALRRHDNATANDIHSDGAPFPRSCEKLLKSISGNSRCVDCGKRNPDWASVSYGVLMCTVCSGKHRSYGVSVSRVRSISMDSWSHAQVLAMLEGGNDQLKNFFSRHEMGETSKIFDLRYQTKAARFYRRNMKQHVETIERIGEWMGREASRKVVTRPTKRIHDTTRRSLTTIAVQ